MSLRHLQMSGREGGTHQPGALGVRTHPTVRLLPLPSPSPPASVTPRAVTSSVSALGSSTKRGCVGWVCGRGLGGRGRERPTRTALAGTRISEPWPQCRRAASGVWVDSCGCIGRGHSRGVPGFRPPIMYLPKTPPTQARTSGSPAHRAPPAPRTAGWGWGAASTPAPTLTRSQDIPHGGRQHWPPTSLSWPNTPSSLLTLSWAGPPHTRPLWPMGATQRQEGLAPSHHQSHRQRRPLALGIPAPSGREAQSGPRPGLRRLSRGPSGTGTPRAQHSSPPVQRCQHSHPAAAHLSPPPKCELFSARLEAAISTVDAAPGGPPPLISCFLSSGREQPVRGAAGVAQPTQSTGGGRWGARGGGGDKALPTPTCLAWGPSRCLTSGGPRNPTVFTRKPASLLMPDHAGPLGHLLQAAFPDPTRGTEIHLSLQKPSALCMSVPV